MLDLARNADDDVADDVHGEDEDDDPLDKYEFWRSFKAQVKILRDEMASGKSVSSDTGTPEGVNAAYEGLMPLLDAMKLRVQGGPQPYEAASHLAPGSQNVALDPNNPFMHNGSGMSPANALEMFRPPVEQNNPAKLKNGVWERDTV